MQWLKRFKKQWKNKVFRLRLCLYGLFLLTGIASFIDKITTFVAVSYYGAVELNPVVAWMMSVIGITPAIIIGYIISLLPIFVIVEVFHKYPKIKKSEGMVWLAIILLTCYSVLFIKVSESNLRWLRWI